jgi:hypothetical protein
MFGAVANSRQASSGAADRAALGLFSTRDLQALALWAAAHISVCPAGIGRT